MTDKITLVRGDDSSFLNQVFLIISYKTNLNLDGYKTRFTIENTYNFMKQFEVQNNATQIDLDKSISSTIEVGTHKCNIKLIDTLGRVNTVHNFELEIIDEFEVDNFIYPNEYEIEIEINDGINKYKNYNYLIDGTKPRIQGIKLEGDKSFQDLGIDKFTIGISNEGIKRHNEDKMSHFDIRDELRNKQDRLIAGANITIIDGIISSLGAEGGGSTDYHDFGNKPKVNGHVLDGDLSLDELGIQAKGDYITKEQLDKKGYLTDVPTGYITEEELEAENFLKEVPEQYFTDEQNEQKYAQLDELQYKQDVLIAGNNINIDEENNISAIIPEEYITEEELLEKNYVSNNTLDSKLNKKSNLIYAGNNIRLQNNMDGTITISAIDSKNPKDIISYNGLNDKPKVNGHTLIGNKTLSDLGIQPRGEYQHVLTAGENIVLENNIISSVIPKEYITENELRIELNNKANKGTTLEEYNISNAYTKEEIETLLKNNNKTNITDSIINAPNGVVTYTEQSIRLQSGLTVLFSDGKFENGEYKNNEITFENDIEITLDDIEYDINKKYFYVLATYDINGTTGLTIIPKDNLKMFIGERIPNTETGYIKNINTNKYYYMEEGEHGINTPKLVYIKVIAQGSINKLENDTFEIASVSPYGSYRFVNQDELLQELNEYQKKLAFGRNFIIKDNKIEYMIPFNYVTKEYLIENNYTTQTNINDAISNHNTNNLSHQDIRNLINNRYNELKTYCDNRFNNVYTKLNQMQAQIDDILRRLR